MADSTGSEADLRELLRAKTTQLDKLELENDQLQELIEEQSSTIRTWEQHALAWERETKAVNEENERMKIMSEEHVTRMSSLEEELGISKSLLSKLRLMVDAQEARSIRSSRSSPLESGSPTLAPSPLLRPWIEPSDVDTDDRETIVPNPTTRFAPVSINRSAPTPTVPADHGTKRDGPAKSPVPPQPRQALVQLTGISPPHLPTQTKKLQQLWQPQMHGQRQPGQQQLDQRASKSYASMNTPTRRHHDITQTMFSPSHGAAFSNAYASPFLGARF